MRSMILRGIIVLFLLAILGIGAVGILTIGYISGSYAKGPIHRLAERAEDMGFDPSFLVGGEVQNSLTQLDTSFVDFQGQVIDIPVDRAGSGGGMTVWGDDLLVLTKEGRVFAASQDGALSELPLNVPDNGFDAYVAESNKPDYAETDHLFHLFRFNDILFSDTPAFRGLIVSTTFFHEDRACYTNRLVRLAVPTEVQRAADLSAETDDWQVFYDTDPCLPLRKFGRTIVGEMAGGRMASIDDQTIYMTHGNYFQNDRPATYDSLDGTSYASVVAIDLTSGEETTIATGFRNPQGIAVASDGTVYATDHGAKGGDEVNVIRPGGNYGWPQETHGVNYEWLPTEDERGNTGRHTRSVSPIYSWTPSPAVSALAYIDGFDPAWDGDLIVGSLKWGEWGRKLFRLRILDGRVTHVETIPIGERVRYITQFGADTLALWLDTNQLVLYRKTDVGAQIARHMSTEIAALEPGLGARVQETMATCAQCHAFEPGIHDSAPSLHGVLGRDIAGTAFEDYSDALLDADGVWTRDSIAAYIADPDTVFEGSYMPGQAVEADVLDALLDLIEGLPAPEGA